MFLQEYGAESPISRLSGVNSGWSPITHDGKSNIGILAKFQKFIKKKINLIIYYYLHISSTNVRHYILIEEF